MQVFRYKGWGVAMVLLAVGACTVTTNEDKDAGAGGSAAGGSGGSGGIGGSGATDSGAGAGGVQVDGSVVGDAGGAAVDGAAGSNPDGGAGDASPETGTMGDGGLTPAATSDLCGGPEASPNEDREHSTAYVVNTVFQGCLQTVADADFYQFTVPSTPAQGSSIVIKVTDVGIAAAPDIWLYSADDNGQIDRAYASTPGGSAYLWFNGRAGATYRAKIVSFGGGSDQAAAPYRLTIVSTGVPDAHEPNDSRATASPITLGAPVQGYLYAGYLHSTGIADEDWDDWYKVTLAAGSVTSVMSDITTDYSGDVFLYDSVGTELERAYGANPGSSVTLTTAIPASGDYYLKIRSFGDPETHGSGSSAPSYHSKPYTLTVTQ